MFFTGLPLAPVLKSSPEKVPLTKVELISVMVIVTGFVVLPYSLEGYTIPKIKS